MHTFIWNVMKRAEKQRTMLSWYSVLSTALRVCDVKLPNFAPFYPIDNNGRRLSFLSKRKYFPDRPPRLSEPYVTGTKQLFCHSLRYTLSPRYWNIPELVYTGTHFMYQNCWKMWYLHSIQSASAIQKLTILACKNSVVLFNTCVPVSGT